MSRRWTVGNSPETMSSSNRAAVAKGNIRTFELLCSTRLDTASNVQNRDVQRWNVREKAA